MRIGRETAGSTSAVSSWGDVEVQGTTTVGASGVIRFSRTVGEVNLGNLEMDGGTIYLTVGSGVNGSSTDGANIVTVNRLHGSSGTITAGKAGTVGVLVVDGAVNGTFGGTIVDGAGAVQLVKDGESVLTVSGVNTYTGATTILGGELALTETGSISSSTEFDIRAGATLSKAGTLVLPALVTMGIDGDSGSIMADELILGGDLVIDISGTYESDQWLLFNATTLDGTFDSVTLMGSYIGEMILDGSVWSVTIGNLDWTLDQSTGILAVVPEPAAAAAMAGFAAMLLAFRVRSRRQSRVGC